MKRRQPSGAVLQMMRSYMSSELQEELTRIQGKADRNERDYEPSMRAFEKSMVAMEEETRKHYKKMGLQMAPADKNLFISQAFKHVHTITLGHNVKKVVGESFRYMREQLAAEAAARQKAA